MGFNRTGNAKHRDCPTKRLRQCSNQVRLDNGRNGTTRLLLRVFQGNLTFDDDDASAHQQLNN